MQKKISIVVPCYNEEECINIFDKELLKTLKKLKSLKYEIIFIDDGSQDNTLNKIIELKKKDRNIRYISFSRNFGKEAAIYAGLEYSKGDYVAVIDVDLQDPIELLVDMYNYITKENYDCVATKRVNRKGEPLFRNFCTKLFYKLIKKVSKVEMVEGARDYRLMTRQVVNAILSLKEYNRYSKGLFNFVGFNTKWIEFENRERVAGKTKWSLFNLFVYAIDGICSFSTAPLVISTMVGILFCIISFILIIVVIVKTLLFGDPAIGWPSMACIIFMVSGIQLFCLGILGEYLSKTYLETKNRPLYIIKKTDKDK